MFILFFGFLRSDLSPWRYMNKCFLVTLCCLIVRRLNLEVATKRLLHQYVKILVSFSAMLCKEVCPCVVWIFLRSLDVICNIRWVLSEGHKNDFKDWCFMNSQLTFLIFVSFLTQWNGRQKHVNQITLNHTTL